jgi:hypothetical protein
MAVFAAHPDTTLVASGVTLVDTAGAPLAEAAAPVPAIIRFDDVKGGVVAFPSTWMFDRAVWDAVGGFTPGEPYAVDWEFQLKVLVHGGQVRAVPESLVRRRVHVNQLGANYRRLASLKIGVVRRHHRGIRKASGGRLGARQMLLDIHMEAAKNLFADNASFAFAVRHLWIVLRRSPALLTRPLFWAHLLVWGGAYGRRSPRDAAADLASRVAQLHTAVEALYARSSRRFRASAPALAEAGTAIDLAAVAVLAQAGRGAQATARLGRIAATRPLASSRVLGRMVGRSIAQRLGRAAG